MNVAVDTNVLAYAEGLNDVVKRDQAVALLEALPPESTFLPVQALGELFSVLVRKAAWPPAQASAAILNWGDAFPLVESSGDVLLAAVGLAGTHGLAFWDALILSAAADARCRLLLSEDLQDGFTWRGVTVTNPFKAERHPLLEALLPADLSAGVGPGVRRDAAVQRPPKARPRSAKRTPRRSE